MKTQREVRESFWGSFPELSRKKIVQHGDQRAYSVDTRCAFVDYVDMLCRGGEISKELANRVTL